MAVEHYRAFLQARRRRACRSRDAGARPIGGARRIDRSRSLSRQALFCPELVELVPEDILPEWPPRITTNAPSSTTFSAKIAAFHPRSRSATGPAFATSRFTPTPTRDPEGFWAEFAGELEWSRPWDTVLDWQPPHAKWFVGGQLNVAVNCLDRHVRGAAPQQGRDHLGRRARRSPHADLLRAVSRSVRVRQRAQVARHQEGRSRRHLHAARAGAGRRDARLRAHRRRPQHRVRRVQRRSRCAIASTTPRRASSSPPTAAIAAARSCR